MAQLCQARYGWQRLGWSSLGAWCARSPRAARRWQGPHALVGASVGLRRRCWQRAGYTQPPRASPAPASPSPCSRAKSCAMLRGPSTNTHALAWATRVWSCPAGQVCRSPSPLPSLCNVLIACVHNSVSPIAHLPTIVRARGWSGEESSRPTTGPPTHASFTVGPSCRLVARSVLVANIHG